MNKSLKISMLVFTIIICVSFFLPWVDVQSQAIGGISKFISGEKQASLKTISGFQVPILANGSDAKLMITIIKIFNPAITDADKKSWLIWCIPGLAVVLFILTLFLGKDKWVNLGVGIVGVAIFAVATFKILTTNLDKLVLNVSIAPGLWVLLYSYLGIGIIGLFRFYQLHFVKNK
jgi:hypothetical protein